MKNQPKFIDIQLWELFIAVANPSGRIIPHRVMAEQRINVPQKRVVSCFPRKPWVSVCEMSV